jgi:hypothetical protein
MPLRVPGICNRFEVVDMINAILYAIDQKQRIERRSGVPIRMIISASSGR